MPTETKLSEAIVQRRRTEGGKAIDSTHTLAHPLWEARFRYNKYPRHADNVFSVTELEKSIKEAIFSRVLGDECPMDLMDLNSIEVGDAWHQQCQAIEQEENRILGRKRYEDERRYTVLIQEAYTTDTGIHVPDLYISGQIDCYDYDLDAILDHKTSMGTTAQKNMSGRDDKWKRQGALYAWLFEKVHMKKPKDIVFLIEIIGLAKRQIGVNGKPEYPKYEWHPNIDDEFIEQSVQWARNRVEWLWMCLNGYAEIPACTYEEQFRKDEIKICKPGKKDPATGELKIRAEVGCSDFESYEEAKGKLLQMGGSGKFRIYRKYGGPTKCEDYCRFKGICEQYNKVECTHPSFIDDITEGDMPF